MIPYILFVIVLVPLWYFKKSKWMLFVIIAFSVLRYDTGWDYASYTEWINHFSKFDIKNERYSYFWQILFVSANKLHFAHLGIVIPNIITYCCIYASCKMYMGKDERGISNALFFYALWPFFYLATWSTIRQQLAVAVGLLMLCCLFKRKYLAVALLFYFAYLSHPSALVLVLLVPAYIFRNYFSMKTTVVVSICAIAVFASLSSVLDWLALEEFDRYERYLKAKNSFGAKLIYLNSLMLIWLCVSFMKNRSNVWAKSSFYNVCLSLSIIAIACDVSLFFVASSNIISRITTYFEIPLCLIIYKTFDGYTSKRLIRPIFSCLLIALFFTYLVIASGKASVEGSSPFVPYQSIFSVL